MKAEYKNLLSLLLSLLQYLCASIHSAVCLFWCHLWYLIFLQSNVNDYLPFLLVFLFPIVFHFIKPDGTVIKIHAVDTFWLTKNDLLNHLCMLFSVYKYSVYIILNVFKPNLCNNLNGRFYYPNFTDRGIVYETIPPYYIKNN